MLLKEALMIWKYRNDRRSQGKSALLRQRDGGVLDETITMETPLPDVDGSRLAVAVAHGAELLDEFRRYEKLDGNPLSGEMLKNAKAEKANAKRQRESEYALERATQIEARRNGRTAQVFNQYAAARKEEEVAARWALLQPAAQVRAKAKFQLDKKAHADLPATKKKRTTAPVKPEPRFKRHTSTQNL